MLLRTLLRPFSLRPRCYRATTSAKMATTIELIPCLKDNYAYLIRTESGAVAVVDPSEASPVTAALQARGLSKLNFILNTHHHWDHTGGNEQLMRETGAVVVGPAADRERIPGISIALKDGETWMLGTTRIICIDTPGHTKGAVSFYLPEDEAIFTGDTLFGCGCGRMFEGTAEVMNASLTRLSALPLLTRVYPGHEYTEANIKFALSVDPENEALRARAVTVAALRAAGKPTIPSTIADEIATNPFLRASSLRRAAGVGGSAAVHEAFGALRAMKDNF